ncbi:MAG: cell division protein FtsQ/DivIB [Victivallaceae bacterium]
MAEKVNKTSRKQSKSSLGRNMLLLLFVLLFIITLVVTGFIFLSRTLFTENDRFILRNFELTGRAPGYWSGRSAELARRLELKVGSDNIFQLKLADLRRKLLAIPSIESCTVRRVMPDTIKVELIERIPRASINNPRSEWVIDSEGIIMSRFESMQIPTQLPVFSGFAANEQPEVGKVFAPALPAVKLLMNTIRNYPDISIIYVNSNKAGKLEFSMRFQNQRIYRATFPAKSDAGYLLRMLQSAIISARIAGDTRTNFDLSFDGNVILQ